MTLLFRVYSRPVEKENREYSKIVFELTDFLCIMYI